MGFYKQYNVIGLMSGTSLDGVDLAFATFYHNKSWQYQLKECQTIPYDEQWQKELKELHLKSITEIKETGKRYAVYLSQLLSNFILENNLQVDLICSHGHTILHQPEKGISLQIGDGKINVKEVEASAIKRLRKEPDEIEQQEETEEETNDDFENLYKGQVSKSGVAILPSKRTRRIPEVKKPSLADEALSELKAEQPEIKEENLETEEASLELSEEVPVEEENKSE